jgi:hypothetical protein
LRRGIYSGEARLLCDGFPVLLFVYHFPYIRKKPDTEFNKVNKNFDILHKSEVFKYIRFFFTFLILRKAANEQ